MVDKKQKKSITRYHEGENVLEEFYLAIANEDERTLSRIHIPRSDVFYVRAAIEADTGVRYTLAHVERAMYLEGYLEASDVFNPDLEE